MKRNFNEKKGITLIALVVTIIVLLLIAGVSISMLTGQNGILTRSADAKKKTGEAENQENERMQEYEDVTDQYVGDSKDGKKLRDENMFEFDTTTGTILRVKEDYLVDYYKYLDWDGIYHSYTTGSRFWCKIKENVDTLIIPNSIQGVPVYEIRCLGIVNIKNIIIEDGIKTIGSIGCYLNNPSVTELGFELEKITIPDSVTSIGWGAFSHCTGLTSINIPSSVTSIESHAFYNCSGLTNINVDRENKNYSDDNGILFNNDKTIIKRYPEGKKENEYTIPSSVTSIGEIAFLSCKALTNITIPGSVTSIGKSAFCNCSGLTNITIPNSVTSIGSDAFSYCSGLTNITISNSVTSIGRYVFYSCSGLTNITIPSSVTSIGSDAFAACSGLTNITIPSSVTSIDRYAFGGCTNLTITLSKDSKLTIPSHKWGAKEVKKEQ